MSMRSCINSRISLLVRQRLEKSLKNTELSKVNLQDLQGGNIPREIWKQRNLKIGSTLMSLIGRYSVDTLEKLLNSRSEKIIGNSNHGNIFPFRKLLESMLKDIFYTPKHVDNRNSTESDDDDSHIDMMNIAASEKNSPMR